jgi:hypothetical protein
VLVSVTNTYEWGEIVVSHAIVGSKYWMEGVLKKEKEKMQGSDTSTQCPSFSRSGRC